jgi:hypothetical protein
MKNVLLLIVMNFAWNSFSMTLNKSMELCTKKSSAEFITRINTLNTVFEIDNKYQYPLKDFELIKIRALDMIKSQSQEKNGKLFWLLEFRPLPEQTDLAIDFYPRIILNCLRSDSVFECAADKDYTSKMRIFKDFSFTLQHVASSDCNDGYVLKVKYLLDIDDVQFEDLKAESLKQIVGSSNNFMAKIIDKLFVPETLFESYIQHLYEKW